MTNVTVSSYLRLLLRLLIRRRATARQATTRTTPHTASPTAMPITVVDDRSLAFPVQNTHRIEIYRWRGGPTGKAFGLAISRSRVQILLEATLCNNLRQVVYTYVPLSPSSIAWYRPKGGDALRLGR